MTPNCKCGRPIFDTRQDTCCDCLKKQIADLTSQASAMCRALEASEHEISSQAMTIEKITAERDQLKDDFAVVDKALTDVCEERDEYAERCEKLNRMVKLSGEVYKVLRTEYMKRECSTCPIRDYCNDEDGPTEDLDCTETLEFWLDDMATAQAKEETP